jgi:hypothetical protein
MVDPSPIAAKATPFLFSSRTHIARERRGGVIVNVSGEGTMVERVTG